MKASSCGNFRRVVGTSKAAHLAILLVVEIQEVEHGERQGVLAA
jgi:hypothetical protein